LKLLHDFDCADLVKFCEKLPQFPDALSTSRLRPNEDVKLSRLNLRESSGLPVERRLSRTSLVLSLTRLVSRRHC
jgi:hypothetical protein